MSSTIAGAGDEYSPYVGGGPVLVWDSNVSNLSYTGFSINCSQSIAQNPFTTGTLKFAIRYWLSNNKVKTHDVYVTYMQGVQSATISRRHAIMRIEVQVTSTVAADSGIPVTIMLKDLVQSGSSKKSCSSKHNKHLKARECECSKAVVPTIPTLPCPTVAINTFNTSIEIGLNFTGTGTNLLWMNPLPCGVAAIQMLSYYTIVQGLLTNRQQIVVTSTTTWENVASNSIFAASSFVPGAAVLTVYPLNPACSPTVFNITLTA
jgi:hypothetical protein